MLSLIICSSLLDISNELKFNIAKTIGVEYELIVIDNSKNNYSIFSAYNKGVKRAKFPYLCFMHEDILYKSEEWGCKVIEHFKNEKVGMIGVAGTTFYPRFPSTWGWPDKVTNNRSHNITHIIEGKEYHELYSYNNDVINPTYVALLDGVWFCIPRKIFHLIRFDDKLFDGFHFYDLDISMQVAKLGYKIQCVYGIDILHYSTGPLNNDWVKWSFVFVDKWRRYLPIKLESGIDLNKTRLIMNKCYDEMLEVIVYTKASKVYILKLFFYYLISDFLNVINIDCFRKFKRVVKFYLK